MKTTFISLGPTCVPAEILKAGGLRSCTYGFDWFRSGGFYVKRFLDMDLDDFLQQHVYNPSIPLRQLLNPSELSIGTSEPAPIDPVYGFTYLYNPHRDLYDPQTRAYFARAFRRTWWIMEDTNVFKEFIVADYANKQAAIFLDRSDSLMQFLTEILSTRIKGGFRITSLRINLTEHGTLADNKNLPETPQLSTDIYEDILFGVACRQFLIDVPKHLDNEEIRRHTYRLIARIVYGRAESFLLSHAH